MLRVAVELLDTQMRLDPFEKQVHLPARCVARAEGGGQHGEVGGEAHPRLAGLGIFESDATQMLGVIRAAGGAGECDGLIAEDARAAIHRGRIDAPKLEVRLGAGHEEGVCLMPHVQPGAVEIAAIHDVDRPSLQHQHVEHRDIAQRAVGDVDEAGDRAAQVEPRRPLHRRLGGAKQRPGKARPAQVDGRRVQRIRRVLQPEATAGAEVERARRHDQALGQFGRDAPLPRLVGLGERRTGDLVPEAQVVARGGLRRQTGLDVAQTLAVGPWRTGHHPEWLGTRAPLHGAVAPLSLDDAGEGRPRQNIQQWRTQDWAAVHGRLREKYRQTARTAVRRSHRHHPLSRHVPLQFLVSRSWGSF